jgi:hypothetical protein
MPAITGSIPGPNSNTFVAAILRAIPEMKATLTPERDRPRFPSAPYIGLTDKRHRHRSEPVGLLGHQARLDRRARDQCARSRAGLELRQPALKLPAFVATRRTIDFGPARSAAPALRNILSFTLMCS